MEFGSLGHRTWQLSSSSLAMHKNQKLEHFQLEHMRSSRNFRIEPRTKNMLQMGVQVEMDMGDSCTSECLEMP